MSLLVAETPGRQARAVRILLVEDHELLAHSLAIALRAQRMLDELAELDDRALIGRVQGDPPDVVLLDLDLGGAIGDGTTLVAAFAQTGARVVVVSSTTDRCRLAAAVEQGAIGWVNKSGRFDLLVDSVLAVAGGEEILSFEERWSLLNELRAWREAIRAERAPFERLTAREAQVLRALADGQSVATIARAWVVSEATVRSQVRGVLSKLGVSSQLEAVAQAFRIGWLTPDDGGRPAG